MIKAYRLLVARLQRGRAGLELSDPSRRHRSRRRRGRAHQERDRHRLAAGGWNRRHDPRLAHRRQRSRNSGRAGARAADHAHAETANARRPTSDAPISYDPFSYRAPRVAHDPSAGHRGRCCARRRGTRSRGCSPARASTRSRTRLIEWATTSPRWSTKTAASSRSIRGMMQRDRRAQCRRASAARDGAGRRRSRRSIAAFRLLAAKLAPQHPILLKDTLSRRDNAQRAISSTRSLGRCRPTSARCSATESATPSWCRAKKRPARRCA